LVKIEKLKGIKMGEKRLSEEDRRTHDRDRRGKSKDGKVQIWIKEEKLAYEAELIKKQVELLRLQ